MYNKSLKKFVYSKKPISEMNLSMMEHIQNVKCLDLNFLGKKGVIAVYLINYSGGGILIESGPGSTIKRLISAVEQNGLNLNEITDIFLTHIHLDHAGAAGWLSRQGINVHVHPKGAPHLLNPEKLLASAKRIYCENMDTLWGDFYPVLPERLWILHDQESINIREIQITPIETLGHADHHFVFFCNDICFSGDIGGVRLADSDYISLPTPPPEFNLEQWKKSVMRLAQMKATAIAPTHFGIYRNPQDHFNAILQTLGELDRWLRNHMKNQPEDDLFAKYSRWFTAGYKAHNLDERLRMDYEMINPPFISFAGIQRYWKKYRTTANSPLGV